MRNIFKYRCFHKVCFTLFIIAGAVLYGFFKIDFQREGVIVAVLDTGIDADHPLLEGKVMQGYDFVRFRRDTDDANGHGTHVAGIIATIAPEADLLPVRVINDQDQVRRSWLAILYAVVKGADIINMSYAEKYNVATDLAIRFARAKGVVLVASSGNLGVDDVFYPAKYEGVYSVAGWDDHHGRIFGNVGRQVKYAAPGFYIQSAATGGGYTIKSGTSMSAAYMSGVIAHLKADSMANPDECLECRLNELAMVVGASHELRVIQLSGIGEEAAKQWERLQSLSVATSVALN